MISKFILTGTFLSVFLLQAQQNVAYFASGCFWCVEAIFETVEGVIDAQSGYCGGQVLNPTYAQICSGRTGHAETVKVTFRPSKVTYTELLEIFFDSHDPSTLNQQGPDIGTQYRSSIFYTDELQRTIASQYIAQLKKQNAFEIITTTIEKMNKFYPAERYHQDFVKNNPYHPYVLSVSKPRKLKFLKKHKTH
ncbi:MAG: peptide-methionine (S)-S-oxide reductase [Cryomorphaceae bacterium]|mgnify:CR=1 FL=1|nr:peptide-methionine (S)-S-oxide reductase [Cryomorphaceae bacterium]